MKGGGCLAQATTDARLNLAPEGYINTQALAPTAAKVQPFPDSPAQGQQFPRHPSPRARDAQGLSQRDAAAAKPAASPPGRPPNLRDEKHPG